MYTWFCSKQHREEVIAALKGLPMAARRILEETVRTQGIERQSISKAVRDLENLGLVFCRRAHAYEPWCITPSLYGEEALHRLEIRERKFKWNS